MSPTDIEREMWRRGEGGTVDHRAEADRLLSFIGQQRAGRVARVINADGQIPTDEELIARAQVHATLALVDATRSEQRV